MIWMLQSEQDGDVHFLLLAGSHDVRCLLHRPPSAVSLNRQVVSVHLDTEESTLSPVSTPTVATHPELNTVLLAPSHHSDLVVDLGE